jgi:hypothetical protein
MLRGQYNEDDDATEVLILVNAPGSPRIRQVKTQVSWSRYSVVYNKNCVIT